MLFNTLLFNTILLKDHYYLKIISDVHLKPGFALTLLALTGLSLL